jgi:D12 class N6 adenine-specific DNA methyltransferase
VLFCEFQKTYDIEDCLLAIENQIALDTQIEKDIGEDLVGYIKHRLYEIKADPDLPFFKKRGRAKKPASNTKLTSISTSQEQEAKPVQYEIYITYEQWRSKLLEKYDRLYKTVQNNLPHLWTSLEFGQSVRNILHVQDCTMPFPGVILGPPSSMKTVGIDMNRKDSSNIIPTHDRSSTEPGSYWAIGARIRNNLAKPANEITNNDNYDDDGESFGFHISDKIGESPAHTKHASDTLDSRIPICYPFKWAGGKRQLLWQLYPLAPVKFDKYIEPFLGGGALFFHLISNKNKPFTAYISDINPELINVYVAVKDDVEKLIKLLTQHQIEYNKAPEECYYKLRDNYNLKSCSDGIERADPLIFSF